MHGRMIVRDIRRNRSVTVLLVVLMALAVMLATASVGTLIQLVGASGALMEKARAPHVVQMHAGDYDPSAVEAWADSRPEVAHHQSMAMLGIDGAELLFDGEPQTTNIQQNALVVPNAGHDLLLSLDDQPLTEVQPGTVWLPVIYDVETDLEPGDTVAISSVGYRLDLTLAGFVRDSIMNPAIASSKRLGVAASDFGDVQAHTGTLEYLIEFWLADPESQSAAFTKAYQDEGLPMSGPLLDASTFQLLTMIGDGIVAAVVILVAVLLLVVAMLCLRLAFLTAAEQDQREIGVMKAIGLPARHVKGFYLAKYALLAGIATILGLLAGLALIPVLTRSITQFMGSAPGLWNWAGPVLAATAVFVVLVLFVLLLLRRFNKINAVEALSPVGAAGKRRRLFTPTLHRSRMPVHFRLGAMDVAHRLGTYVLLFLVFAVSAFIMIVPVSSAATANAPGFTNYMGVGSMDLRVDIRQSDEAAAAFADAIDRLESDPDVADVAPMVTTRHATVDGDGNAASLYVENGDHGILPVAYADGRGPQSESEIALSLLALNQAGLRVGDALPLEVGGQQRTLEIVGSYQDITNGGKTAKASLPTETEQVMWYVVGVRLAGADPSAKAAQYTDELRPAQVADVQEWRGQTLGTVSDQLTVTATVAALVAIVLAAMMTALFVRMLLARDTAQVAIQRALGADDAGLRLQYLTRVLLVLVAGVLVGTVAANTVGEGMFNVMFEVMYGGFETIGQGTSRIAFDVHPLLTYLALPVALLAGVVAATMGATRLIAAANIADLTTE